MPAVKQLQGLYAITPENHVDVVYAAEQAILGGARAVQYRDKSADTARRESEAGELCRLCNRHEIPLLINDDIELAARVGAAGVHLGQLDQPMEAARRRLGDDAIIGISCYNSLQHAIDAGNNGADYVAFGRFFTSRTKPDAKSANPALLQRARELLSVPIVAIGGITPENAGTVIAAGADMVAVIDALFGQQDIRGRATTFSKLFG